MMNLELVNGGDILDRVPESHLEREREEQREGIMIDPMKFIFGEPEKKEDKSRPESDFDKPFYLDC